MMKETILYLSFCCIVALFSGCSEDAPGDVEQPDALTSLAFGVEVQTRAASTTVSSIQQFGVFCFDTGGAFWKDASATATPNKLFNRLVELVDKSWVYTPAVEWGGGAGNRYTFFGYSPYAAGSTTTSLTGNNITLLTAAGTIGTPSLRFETLPDVMTQHDLMIAQPRYDLRPSPVPVKMVFDHALAKIGIKAYSAAVGTFIESIEVEGVRYKGSVALDKPTQWNTETDLTTFTIDFWGGIPVRGDKDHPVDVTAPSNYLMTVPQDLTANSTAKLVFKYRQGITTGITKEYILKEKWESGKGTIYVINLGGSPNSDVMVERIEMEDWTVETGGDLEI